MRSFAVIAGLAVLASAASTPYKSSAPGCVKKCWEFTKYVTLCQEDEGRQCLCDDSEYQSNVYQCLYSQCQTALLPNALHHTLAICATPNRNVENGHKPALLRQDVLKNIKRDEDEAANAADCNSTVVAPLPSGPRKPMQSVSASRVWQYRGSQTPTPVVPPITVVPLIPTPTTEPVQPPPAVVTTPVSPPPANPPTTPLSGGASVLTRNAAILAVAGGLALIILA